MADIGGHPILLRQIFGHIEDILGDEFLPPHPIPLIDDEDLLHEGEHGLGGTVALDLPVVGEDVLLDYLLVHLGRLHGFVGQLPIHHFVENNSDGPDVGLEPILLLPHHLGRHRDDGTQRGVISIVAFGDHLREAQVHYFVDPIVAHDVVGFEVPVDHAQLVHCLSRLKCTEMPVMICFRISMAYASGMRWRL